MKEKAPEKQELFKELLVYDLYLRENLKSRPDFARDMITFKEEVREFFVKEEEVRTLLPGYTGYDHKQMAKMTHVEAFEYNVWDALAGQVEKLEGTRLCLFDYQERNPLTYEAKVILL